MPSPRTRLVLGICVVASFVAIAWLLRRTPRGEPSVTSDGVRQPAPTEQADAERTESGDVRRQVNFSQDARRPTHHSSDLTLIRRLFVPRAQALRFRRLTMLMEDLTPYGPNGSDVPPPPPPTPPEPEIHRAARIGDTATFGRLVENGADVDARGDLEFDHGPFLRGLTPLMVAARSVDGAGVETLRWLLAHGADLRALSEAGVTAAWYAAGKGGRWGEVAWRAEAPHVERLRWLLDAGLEPLEAACNGRSLLVEACGAGDPARVALLLERGAPHTPIRGPSDVPRRVPMFDAASSGSAECVHLLLRAGAAADSRDEFGETPLMCAASAAVVRCLVEAGADPRAEASNGEDAIDRAIDPSGGEGEMPPWGGEVASELVACGVPLQRVGRNGFSRLALAAFHRGADAVDWLLSRGVRPEPDSYDHRTPLHAICWQGERLESPANAACERILRALVAAGDDVEARDDKGCSPLAEAVSGDWGNPTAARVLLAFGARPDEPDFEGTTPLMKAASLGEFECVRLLLDAGADPTRHDGEGRSALDHARSHHGIWVTLARDASPAQRDVHQDALAKAATTLRLLEGAAASPPYGVS